MGNSVFFYILFGGCWWILLDSNIQGYMVLLYYLVCFDYNIFQVCMLLCYVKFLDKSDWVCNVLYQVQFFCCFQDNKILYCMNWWVFYFYNRCSSDQGYMVSSLVMSCFGVWGCMYLVYMVYNEVWVQFLDSNSFWDIDCFDMWWSQYSNKSFEDIVCNQFCFFYFDKFQQDNL